MGKQASAQPLWIVIWHYLVKLKILILFDPTVPLLGIYPIDILSCAN